MRPTEEIPGELHGPAARLERYGVLRSAQRVLYRMRGTPGHVPGSVPLREVLQRLRALGAARSEQGGDPEAPGQALEKIDGLLTQIADGLRSIAIGLPLADLRVAVRQSRPEEVAALIDLCLEEPSELTRYTELVDYLVTEHCTDLSGPERVLGSDPVMATPRLRAVCERIASVDGDEVERVIPLFQLAISELSQAEEVGDLINRMNERKQALGPSMFVPALLRAVILYNIAVSNRIDDDLEAEGTIQRLDLEVTLSTLPELDSPPEEKQPADPTEKKVPDKGPGHAAEREAIDSVSEAISRVLHEDGSGTGAAAEIARSLDLSVLSLWERQAITSNEPGQATLRSVVSVGLVLKSAVDLEPTLRRLGLGIARLEGHWVPELDTRLQERITEHLTDRADGDARRLSQTRVKFLYKILETMRRKRVSAELHPESMGIPEPDELHPPHRSWGPSRARSRTLVVAAAVGILVISVGIQVYSAKDEHAVSVLSPALLAEVSPYLQSAYRDGLGFGPRLFGTLTDSWKTLDETRRYAEAMKMGTRLRWNGVQEVMLFDRERRLQVRFVGGELLHPRAPGET